jgi:hypothetical protein
VAKKRKAKTAGFPTLAEIGRDHPEFRLATL